MELVNLRLSATGTATSRADFGGLRLGGGRHARAKRPGLVFFDRGAPRVETPVLAREAVDQGPVRARRSSRATTHHRGAAVVARHARPAAVRIATRWTTPMPERRTSAWSIPSPSP